MYTFTLYWSACTIQWKWTVMYLFVKGNDFCLFIRFWYLILELFRQCDLFRFVFYFIIDESKTQPIQLSSCLNIWWCLSIQLSVLHLIYCNLERKDVLHRWLAHDDLSLADSKNLIISLEHSWSWLYGSWIYNYLCI